MKEAASERGWTRNKGRMKGESDEMGEKDGLLINKPHNPMNTRTTAMEADEKLDAQKKQTKKTKTSLA